ncbi:hypothetical protein PIB30_046536 [Stylosanthes scabra]|uniref:Aminotransferase-like plant mobile domain-containing protein n=1 Tax=Stylosanthes scabra TaxID=79078 RepID=A0ABU6SH00_9FABA|nr:hypothetical protein [Stylosanthes scabra]
MHHVDRVKRQFGGEQQIPEDPVNLDGLLGVSAQGEDQHWPTRHAEWYDGWRGRFAPEHQITITPMQYPAMPAHAYFEWWLDACRVRFLSPADALDDPSLDGLPNDVPATASQPRDKLSLPGDVPASTRQRRAFRPDIKRQASGGVGRGVGDGGATDTQRTHDTGDGPVIGEDIPVDDAFFTGAEHHFQSSFGEERLRPASSSWIRAWISLPQCQSHSSVRGGHELDPAYYPPFTWVRQHRSIIPSVGYTTFMGVSHEPQWVRWFTAQSAPPHQPPTVIQPQPRRT